jgi:hypothetical protein
MARRALVADIALGRVLFVRRSCDRGRLRQVQSGIVAWHADQVAAAEMCAGDNGDVSERHDHVVLHQTRACLDTSAVRAYTNSNSKNAAAVISSGRRAYPDNIASI